MEKQYEEDGELREIGLHQTKDHKSHETEQGYTKGEWRQGSHNDEPFARSCLSIFREDGRRIAEIGREGFMSIEEAEANARLIAAAPDLYEACKQALDIFAQHDLTNSVISGISLRLNEAIAKVEGGVK